MQRTHTLTFLRKKTSRYTIHLVICASNSQPCTSFRAQTTLTAPRRKKRPITFRNRNRPGRTPSHTFRQRAVASPLIRQERTGFWSSRHRAMPRATAFVRVVVSAPPSPTNEKAMLLEAPRANCRNWPLQVNHEFQNISPLGWPPAVGGVPRRIHPSDVAWSSVRAAFELEQTYTPDRPTKGLSAHSYTACFGPLKWKREDGQTH